MNVVGVICEYDPFHCGHAWHFAQIRAAINEARILCVMSGDVTQRGELAMFSKYTRTEIALHAGADLVLELPPEWACAPARQFATGAIQMLLSTGIVTHLSFGSESGDISALTRLSMLEEMEGFELAMQSGLEKGLPYAAARQEAAALLLGEDSRLLSYPNDTLAVEYLRACRIQSGSIQPLAVRRRGAGHDGESPQHGLASGSYLRQQLFQGDWDHAKRYLTESGARLLLRDCKSGCAPVSLSRCEQAVLYRLRCSTIQDFASIADCGPMLARRMARAAAEAESMEAFLQLSRSRRVPLARVRRILLSLYLGLTGPVEPPHFLRVLGLRDSGRELLREMRTKSSLPPLLQSGAVRKLGGHAEEAFAKMALIADLRRLAQPYGGTVPMGGEWRQTPVRLFSAFHAEKDGE